MVEVTEDEKNVYVKITKRVDVDLERVYNKNYFFSFGLDVLDDEDKTKKIASASELALQKTESLLKNIDLIGKIEFVISKSEKESGVQTFTSYLENLKKRSNLNPLTTFSISGVDYIILENITNDLCSCLDFIKIRGMQLIEKKKDAIYFINGRFVILSEDLIMFEDKMVSEEESVLKILSEICDITYSRGEDHFKSSIYRTLLYNKLKRLIQ